MTVNTPNTLTLIVAHDAETTENLFQMVHTFWEELPPEKRPKTRYKSKRVLHFAHNGSKLRLMTARKSGGGRSMTVHNLHLSEAAFYQNPKLLTGLLQAVPEGGNVFVESTANGEGGIGQIYHDEYQKAKKGETPYAARFYAWWQHSEYETDPPPGFRRDEDEDTLVQRWDLDARFGKGRTDRKLAWRRRKKAEPGMGNQFDQEYPGDDKVAFLVSGSRFFTDWDEDVHVVYPSEVTIERHWPRFGGYDWGYGKPACFELGTADERGRVLLIDEEYNAGLTDDEQAEKVLECLKRNGLDPSQVTIHADPAMWAEKTDWSGKKVANVKAFHAKGLKFVKATNDRIHGWMNFRRYLHDRDQPDPNKPAVPFLRVLRGKCPNLIRTMPLMVHDDLKPEDMESDPNLSEDHAPDTARYLLAAKPRPSGPDPNQPKPGDHRPSWMKRAASQGKRKL